MGIRGHDDHNGTVDRSIDRDDRVNGVPFGSDHLGCDHVAGTDVGGMHGVDGHVVSVRRRGGSHPSSETSSESATFWM